MGEAWGGVVPARRGRGGVRGGGVRSSSSSSTSGGSAERRTGGGGAPPPAPAGHIEKLLLVNEAAVVCVWTPQSPLDGTDFIRLMEGRALARDAIDAAADADADADGGPPEIEIGGSGPGAGGTEPGPVPGAGVDLTLEPEPEPEPEPGPGRRHLHFHSHSHSPGPSPPRPGPALPAAFPPNEAPGAGATVRGGPPPATAQDLFGGIDFGDNGWDQEEGGGEGGERAPAEAGAGEGATAASDPSPASAPPSPPGGIFAPPAAGADAWGAMEDADGLSEATPKVVAAAAAAESERKDEHNNGGGSDTNRDTASGPPPAPAPPSPSGGIFAPPAAGADAWGTMEDADGLSEATPKVVAAAAAVSERKDEHSNGVGEQTAAAFASGAGIFSAACGDNLGDLTEDDEDDW